MKKSESRTDPFQVNSQKADRHWWMVGKYDFIAHSVDHCVGPGNASTLVLDGGCGGGFPASRYAAGNRVVGIDADINALHKSTERGMRSAVQSEVVNLPIRNSSVDRFFMIDLIEHVEDDRMVMEEVHRVLKPGGILVLVAPAGPSLYDSHDRRYGHFRRYRLAEIERLGHTTKFENLLVSYWGVLLFPLLWLIRKARGFLFPGKHYDDFADPLEWINRLLIKYLHLESSLVRSFRFPFGISIIAIFRSQQGGNEIL